MIIPDVNLLLYANIASCAEHEVARLWWDDALNGTEKVGLCWVALLGFIRISTQRRVWERPLPMIEAERLVKLWLYLPSTQIIEPGFGHPDQIFDLLRQFGTAGNLTTDAHIAALALEWNATVYSADTDFSRWPQVRCINPLV